MNAKRKGAVKQGLSFFAFTSPAVVLIIAFVGIPFCMCIYYSLCKWNGWDKSVSFNGLDNYVKLFTGDAGFWDAFRFTFIYAAGVVALVNLTALFIASLLQTNIRAKGLFRSAFYIPNIIGMVVIGFIWKFICVRVFDALLAITGWRIFGLSWLGDPNLTVITTILVTVWQNLGFYLVIYIAGLQSVPNEMLEAASIDGAGGLKRFFRITFPLIMPSVSFCMFYSAANSLKMFELIFSLTGGGPGTATTPMTLNIYNTLFNNNQFGYGSAKSVFLFVVVMIISVAQVTFFKNREVEA